MWPGMGATAVQFMEMPDRNAEPSRVSAHLVQGNEPVIVVEGCVFDSLGGGRARELLEPQDKRSLLRRGWGCRLEGQQGANFPDRIFSMRRPLHGFVTCATDDKGIGRRKRERIGLDIRAVVRPAGDNFQKSSLAIGQRG